MTRVAVAGIGYWGKNLVRVFDDCAEVTICVHTGGERNAEWLRENYPSVDLTTNFGTVLDDPSVDAIAIATPIGTHYSLTKAALESGKDVFVEKPLAESPAQSEELVQLSRTTNAVVFVGYIFCHHPTIQTLIELARSSSVEWGLFGWIKEGGFGTDIYADLVSHQVAIALQLFEEDPVEIRAIRSRIGTHSTDVVSARLAFPGGETFDIDVNRLVPESQKFLQVRLEDGNSYCWMEDGLYAFSRDDGEYETVERTTEEPLIRECKEFLSVVEGASSHSTTAEFGYRVDVLLQELRDRPL